ncbi:hypothetical protein BC828DRAFT_81425 [Blastocladiella britannica]|nr:hypothetical protein BC828DRAFT_81425 [Blastocladiella britannica]
MVSSSSSPAMTPAVAPSRITPRATSRISVGHGMCVARDVRNDAECETSMTAVAPMGHLVGVTSTVQSEVAARNLFHFLLRCCANSQRKKKRGGTYAALDGNTFPSTLSIPAVSEGRYSLMCCMDTPVDCRSSENTNVTYTICWITDVSILGNHKIKVYQPA